MCLFSITAFADSVYYEMREDDNTLTLELKNNGSFTVKGNDTSINVDTEEETAEKILAYFKNIINKDDEIQYDSYERFQDCREEQFIDDGYLLKICEGVSCREYVSETPLVSINELENGELGTIIQTEMENILGMVFGIMGLVFIAPIIFIVVIIIIIAVVCKKINKANNQQYRTVKKTNITINRVPSRKADSNESINDFMRNRNEMPNKTSEKERYKRGDKSPFDL